MTTTNGAAALLAAAAVLLPLAAQPQRPELTPPEKAISDQMRKLRSLPDDRWKQSVADIARQIQQLPPDPGRLALLGGLSNLCTEGDAGRDTLQLIASTMADALRAGPQSNMYDTLAQLARYEHLNVSLDVAPYRDAVARLEAEDRRRANADFTLADLSGKSWSLRDLRGRIVLLNFWATWCPPCRKEMPDMQALYGKFSPRGLVILAISDETMDKVKPFIEAQKYTYPILLDPGRKVHDFFAVEGIPKSFVYGRDGKLAAQAIDRRTMGQFLAMLQQAGLQ